MKLGLFGGTFDPIHRGHIALAHAAREKFGLNRVLFVPANVPPHKQSQPLSAFAHRYAMLGDLNIAEPGALIGFAGPRVIEQTIRQKLPPGFQRSEFLLEHGMLDAVVHRRDLKNYLIRALDFMKATVVA